MGLHDQITADNAIFFNIEDFAESAVYRSPDGNDTSITTVCDGEQLADKQTDSGITQVRLNQFAIKISDVPNPLINGVVVYNLESWPIVGIAERDFASVTVVCELPANSMQGRGSYFTRQGGMNYRRS